MSMLDWFDDPKQRRRGGSHSQKGKPRSALVRAILFNRLGELSDRTSSYARTARPPELTCRRPHA